MGETSAKRDRRRLVTLDPASVKALASGIATALAASGLARAEHLAPDPHTPGDTPPYAPWLRYDDANRRETVAFLDDTRTLRFVATMDLDGVPAGWCPLYVGPSVTRSEPGA